MNFFFCRSSSKQQKKKLEKKNQNLRATRSTTTRLMGGKIKTKNQQEKTLKLQKNFKLCPQCLDLDIPASKTKFDYSSAWESFINRNPASKESKKTLSLNISERDLDNITSENSVQQESRRSRRLALCTRSWRALRDATACAPDNKTILKARSHCPNINTIGGGEYCEIPISFANLEKRKISSSPTWCRVSMSVTVWAGISCF